MLCPKCGAENQAGVIDSRSYNRYVYRRRKCQLCGHRFSTVEVPVIDARAILEEFICKNWFRLEPKRGRENLASEIEKP